MFNFGRSAVHWDPLLLFFPLRKPTGLHFVLAHCGHWYENCLASFQAVQFGSLQFFGKPCSCTWNLKLLPAFLSAKAVATSGSRFCCCVLSLGTRQKKHPTGPIMCEIGRARLVVLPSSQGNVIVSCLLATDTTIDSPLSLLGGLGPPKSIPPKPMSAIAPSSDPTSPSFPSSKHSAP